MQGIFQAEGIYRYGTRLQLRADLDGDGNDESVFFWWSRRAARPTTLKVSEKGAVSMYGLGRFPVTLYKEQWKKLLAMAGEIEQFIQANDHILKSKGDPDK